MMGRMKRDWERLGRVAADTRRALRLTQKQLAAKLGVGRGTIQAIERGEEFVKVTQTMRGLERAFGWADGSIEAVLDGGEPTPLKDQQQDSAVEREVQDTLLALAPDLPLDIRYELSAEAGPVIGSTVLTVPGASPGSRMIVVMKGEPDASPEKLRADLLAWADEQRRLRDQSPPESQSTRTREP